MKPVKLSSRMQALVDMVSKGRTVCDIGCDHGFVSIYLVQYEIASKVYAMDVRTGPLERAKEHIEQCQLEAYIEPRLSDGLENLKIGEADCMICAGMGGPLMMKILSEGREKAFSMKELILQPQSEIVAFRKFLREEGYTVADENMIYEDGKYYPMMKVVPGRKSEVVYTEEMQLWDCFGEILLKKKNPVLKQYLQHNKNKIKKLYDHLKENAADIARMTELEHEIYMIDRAFLYMSE